ncbi:hypothetical protein [Sphingomonas cavernae]|uniref:hypothetical protein n=1 Tax=Sphingomonas cavernae TaxID=2320861 RepID=UPI0015FF8C8D|nr:hypothetical protein [Sphingomonas cavernae]
MEDLNFLYYRQQVALMHARSADDPYNRRAQERLARAYGDRIARFRRAGSRGLAAA